MNVLWLLTQFTATTERHSLTDMALAALFYIKKQYFTIPLGSTLLITSSAELPTSGKSALASDSNWSTELDIGSNTSWPMWEETRCKFSWQAVRSFTTRTMSWCSIILRPHSATTFAILSRTPRTSEATAIEKEQYKLILTMYMSRFYTSQMTIMSTLKIEAVWKT